MPSIGAPTLVSQFCLFAEDGLGLGAHFLRYNFYNLLLPCHSPICCTCTTRTTSHLAPRTSHLIPHPLCAPHCITTNSHNFLQLLQLTAGGGVAWRGVAWRGVAGAEPLNTFGPSGG